MSSAKRLALLLCLTFVAMHTDPLIHAAYVPAEENDDTEIVGDEAPEAAGIYTTTMHFYSPFMEDEPMEESAAG